MKILNWLLLTTLSIVMLSCSSQNTQLSSNNTVTNSNASKNGNRMQNLKKHLKVGITELDFTIASGKKMHAYIWYPTLTASDQKDFITSKVMKEEMARQFGMPKFSISTKETTQASVDAKIIKADESLAKLPVVFFSHGFASFARQNNKMMEH